MKKELLLATLMSATIAPQLSNASTRSDLASSIMEKANLTGKVFMSESVFRAVSGKQVKYKMEIIKAEDLGMDYQVLVSIVDSITGETIPTFEDDYFFLKHVSGSKYKFFDCDSSLDCEGDPVAKLSFFKNSNGQEVMKIMTRDLRSFEGVGKELLLTEVQ